MKKRAFLFSIFLILSFCMLTLVIGADSIYSDFTKPGVNGESPIFSFNGYSTSNEGGICVGYDIDRDALDSYASKTGSSMKYGIVVACKDLIVGDGPLDQNGVLTEENIGKALVFDFDLKFNKISAHLNNISEKQKNTYLILSLFIVVPGEGVVYIGNESSYTGPESTSFNDALSGLPPIPSAIPTQTVVIGNMTYSTNAVTELAWDRVKQQNASLADYNTGSSKTSSELTGFFGIKTKAQLIAAGGSLINMPAASALMSHYLKNTGETYTIDVASFLTDDSGALASRNTAINNALRAAEQLAQKGRKITINQLAEGHPMQGSLATDNWRYAIGSYFDDVDVINLTVSEVDGVKTYTADIKYIVTDYYNWDTNDYNEFKGIVSPHDLHELHKAGIAKEFLSYGEITYSSITWTEGQTVDQIQGLN